MGYKITTNSKDIAIPKSKSKSESRSSALSEALIVATMCIVGLPVEVYVKDGSVYSGIFHTASVEQHLQYGVVLKKARMTRKGKSKTNVDFGQVIETLVILSGDLVQVVAKGVVLDANSVSGNLASDNLEAATCIVSSSDSQMTETKKFSKFYMNGKKANKSRNLAQNRNGTHQSSTPKMAGRNGDKKQHPCYLGSAPEFENREGDENLNKHEVLSFASVCGRETADGRSQVERNANGEESKSPNEGSAGEVECSNSLIDASIVQVKLAEQGRMKTDVLSCHSPTAHVHHDKQCGEMATTTNTYQDVVAQGVSSFCSRVTDTAAVSSSDSTEVPAGIAPQQNSESIRTAKEFKLNPEAKIFSPSFAKPISATSPTVSSVARVAYVPSAPPPIAVAAGQSEVGFSHFATPPSAPVKFVPYGNLMTGNAVIGSQYLEPIIGHPGNRTQPMRYPGQYNPVQPGPTYAHPNSQAVMVGRMGQIVCVNQYPQDLVQGTASISPISMRPMMTSQVQFPKNQGTVAGQPFQVGISSPFTTGGQQFALPSQLPLLQPTFPVHVPVQAPAPNAPFFGTKLL